MVAHTARAHARLAPSASHRWMECPGSIRLSEGIPNKSSVYAAEGTAAHELASHCLEHDLEPEGFLDRVVNIEGKDPGEKFGYAKDALADGGTTFRVDEEMVEGVRLYVDSVNSLRGIARTAELDVETRLDMTHIHPDIYGTGDSVVYQEAQQHLHVVDFKYGRGVAVEPDENPQLMLYGAGALRRYHNRPVKKITLHIVQPRAPHHYGPVRSWHTDPITLMEFEDDLQKLAAATEAADAPLKAGEWCRFCPAAGVCPALRERAKAAAIADFAEAVAEGQVEPEDTLRAPQQMSSDAIAKVLKEAELIGNWLKAVQAYAHAEAMAGRMPTGFKLVAKRATRRWKDPEAALTTLVCEHDFAERDVCSEPELLSPAQLEKVLGKKRFATLGDLVTKQSSGTNLVPESDARPSAKADGVRDFEGVE